VGSSVIVNGEASFHLSPGGEFLGDNNIAKKMFVEGVNLAAFASRTYTFTSTLSATARPGRYWLTVIVWDTPTGTTTSRGTCQPGRPGGLPTRPSPRSTA
jgi:hypothetical protein